MKDLLRMAWRNIWRNRRRSLITMASIFFAVWLSTFMRSVQLGMYGDMMRQSIESFTGYLQVQQADYLDEPNLDNSLEQTNQLQTTIEQHELISAAVPRIESFALASSGVQTKGVILLGIDPLAEEKINPTQQKIIAGRQLIAGDQGAVLSSELAKYLKLSVGDSLVLMGSGRHGQSAAGLFPISGIVKAPSPELDKQLVYLELAQAQQFLSMENHLSAMLLQLKNNDKFKNLQQQLNNQLPDGLMARNWEEMNPELKQTMAGDDVGGQIMIAILYIIVFFGIVGTLQMMIAERKKEFAVLIAIGMKRTKIASMITLEMLLIGGCGALAGLLAAAPLALSFYHHPIRLAGDMAQMYQQMGIDPQITTMPPSNYFLHQALVVLLMVLLACTLPVWRIRKMSAIAGR